MEGEKTMTDVLMCGENPIGQVSEYTAGETIKSDSIAPVESLVSLHAYAKDDLLVYNGELYIVTSAIAVGDTITSKIERTTTTSYVNPTRMNHIEDGIADVSTTIGDGICVHTFPSVVFGSDGLKRIDTDSAFTSIIGSSDKVIRAQVVGENSGYTIVLSTWGSATYLALRATGDMSAVGNRTLDVKVIYSSTIKTI